MGLLIKLFAYLGQRPVLALPILVAVFVGLYSINKMDQKDRAKRLAHYSNCHYEMEVNSNVFSCKKGTKTSLFGDTTTYNDCHNKQTNDKVELIQTNKAIKICSES